MKAADHELLVLVVDDDPVMGGELSTGLKACGLRVVTASNRVSASRLNSLHRPHVILFSVELVDHNGFDVWRLLRDSGGGTHAVLYSRSATALEGFTAHQLGFDAVLLKPASIDDIVSALRRAVSGSEATDPVDVFCRFLQTSVADDLTSVLLLPRVVALLGDVRVGLLEFGRLADMCRGLAVSPPAQGGGTDGILNQVCRLREIRQTIPRPLPHLLRIIACSRGASDGFHDWPDEVRHQLHAVTGRWPQSWHRVARLQRAIQELVRTGEQVAQIAIQLGFSCGGRLCHDLHDVTGLSPTQLRCLHKTPRTT